MTFHPTRWAMAAAVTAGLAGLIGLAAPAASASNHAATRPPATISRLPVRLLPAVSGVSPGRPEACVIRIAPIDRLSHPVVRPSAPRLRLTKLRPDYLLRRPHGKGSICGPVAIPLACGGASYRFKATPTFARLPDVRVRAIKLAAGARPLELRFPAGRVAVGSFHYFAWPGCKASK